jgi:hypothetical protein
VFEVVETTLEEPIRIFAAPEAVFKPGLVGQFCELNGNIVCTLSDGSKPIGIVDDTKNKEHWFDPKSLVRIWIQRMVFRTDQFDKEVEYRTGMPLYVNKHGLLTSKKPIIEDSQFVARVISPPAANKPFFEALWL